jgi:signal transduction histidine kinase
MLGKKAVAYLDREDYAEQLSVRAIKSGQVQTSGSAYDLIRPVVPKRPLDMIQKLLGIKQVIAIPFFLENEAIGNLYVVSHRPKFSTQEQDILKAFGQQAAISIHNAQLYRKSEERRDAAQIFAKMAFSAAASVHALRNNVGAFRMYYQMIKPHLDDPTFQELGAGVMDSLNEAAHLLDSLHEPWRVKPDALTDINACMTRAVGKTVPNQGELKVKHGIVFHVSLAKNLPLIKTSPHMLTEAFMVLIRNALDAIREKTGAKDSGGDIWIETRKANDWGIEVVIRDNGAGIRIENLSKVFELGWSTKTAGMGFGMFWTKEYVEGLGGSITVDSVWQKGTSHLIKLPASIKE